MHPFQRRLFWLLLCLFTAAAVALASMERAQEAFWLLAAALSVSVLLAWNPRSAKQGDTPDALSFWSGSCPAMQENVLELIGSGRPLEEILDRLCRLLEDSVPEARCVISITNEETGSLDLSVASDLSLDILQAVERIVQRKYLAASRSDGSIEEVGVCDLASEPDWTDRGDLALLSGLKTYWSRPVRSADGRLQAVLTILRPGRGNPTRPEREAVKLALDLSAVAIHRDRAECERLEAQTQLVEAIESIDEGFVLFDADDRFVLCNSKAREMYPMGDEVMVPGARFEDIVRAAAERGQFVDAIGRVEEWVKERLDVHRKPREWVEQQLWDGRWLRVAERKTRSGGTVGIRVDITRHKQTEQELRLAAQVFESAADAALITDGEARILRVNRAFATSTGYNEADIVGRSVRKLAAGHRQKGLVREVWTNASREGAWRGELWLRRMGGEPFPAWVNVTSVNDSDGNVAHFIGFISDLTEKKRSETRIMYLAHFDALTNLPNRRLFQDRLERAMGQARRNGSTVVVLFLDLDRFKPINDSLGHPTGDRLLQVIAGRLTGCVRETDTVARLGGDEFTVILPGRKDHGEAAQNAAVVAQKILRSVAEPALFDGHEVTVTPSIGIAVYPQDGMDVADLVKNADTAMYHAKSRGRNNYQFYAEEMNAQAMARLLMENGLRRAFRQNELRVYYQPIVELKSGRIQGAEALLRWQHPERGLLVASEFIDVAEETGLVVMLEEWVLEEACRQAKSWQGLGFPGFWVAVNISPRHFRQGHIVEVVRRTLAKCEQEPSLLNLEITERVFFDQDEQSLGSLSALSDMGVRLSIDDFGIGYSSLAYLKRLPTDTLKIDRVFIKDIAAGPDQAAIVAAIIAMAKSLNLSVIAEGVEVEEQLRFLEEHGCGIAQGFIYSDALSPDALERRFLRGVRYADIG